MKLHGYHFPTEIILQAVRYYVEYKLSYRDSEEIYAERGIRLDHFTINRWVIRFAPLIEQNARARKRQVSNSWRMDETYIKIKGQWWYYYRAVDKHGDIVDFYLSQTRDEKPLKPFSERLSERMDCQRKSLLIKVGPMLKLFII